jgi:hypothetical protein
VLDAGQGVARFAQRARRAESVYAPPLAEKTRQPADAAWGEARRRGGGTMRVGDVPAAAAAIAGSGSSMQRGLQQDLANAYFLQAHPPPPTPHPISCRK